MSASLCRSAIVLIAIGCPLNALYADDVLATKIKEVIDAPEYKQARWGILVVDAKSGKPIFEKNAERLFTPASTTKLFSCATALAELGPNFRFTTPVYARGRTKDGILEGDLILIASGDLTFGGRTDKDGKIVFVNNDHTYANGGTSEAELTDTNPLLALESLARQIADAGIKEVKGEILIDDRLFNRARGTGSGPDVLSPMIVNDNVLNIVVTPGAKPGDPARVRMRPETAYYQMDAEVVTTDQKKTGIILQSMSPLHFAVRGSIDVGVKQTVRVLHVEQPAYFARALFIECMRRAGVRVQASVFQPGQVDIPAKQDYEKLMRVAVYKSPPLSQAIAVTLKVSHNLYASTLPLLVAASRDERTLEQGLRRQGKFLKELGVPVETISFAGGAGGANADAVTPLAVVKLLQAMDKRAEGEAFFKGLPVLGVDGTLADAVAPDSPAKGRVRGKTGTLAWYDAMNDRVLLRSKAIAGSMETAKGTKLYFALFLNDLPLPNGAAAAREGKTLGKLCEIIYQNGP
jgi:D-alanyl-D-alanine carboxypeptidase/D-alanyl-D-alanine-endopeptidase (penicillin-binding protein 4)